MRWANRLVQVIAICIRHRRHSNDTHHAMTLNTPMRREATIECLMKSTEMTSCSSLNRRPLLIQSVRSSTSRHPFRVFAICKRSEAALAMDASRSNPPPRMTNAQIMINLQSIFNYISIVFIIFMVIFHETNYICPFYFAQERLLRHSCLTNKKNMCYNVGATTLHESTYIVTLMTSLLAIWKMNDRISA